MSFVYAKHFIWLAALFVVFLIVHLKMESRYFAWIKMHWFYRRSFSHKLYSFFYLAGIFLMLIAALDFRGAETMIEASIPDQKTIIMVDVSASMAVEDVKPNRFKKALLMARHFVRKAVGHQIALVIFSETQRRIVPFTDDLDLLDSKIAALNEWDISSGGSNIRQAIEESIQYFKYDNFSTDQLTGNILLFTDAEDSEAVESIKVPEAINIAVVGVGTSEGGNIPLRGRDGELRGFKKFQRKEIVSRLNEKFLKEMASYVKNYKYWVALSYSIPTEEILSFFRQLFKSRLSKNDVRIRPVYSHYLVSIGILFLLIAFSLRIRKSYFICFYFLFINIQGPVVFASMDKEDRKYNDQIVSYMERLKKYNMPDISTLKLAEYFLKAGDVNKSLILYDEIIINAENWDENVLTNYGTALLQGGEIDKAINIFRIVLQKSNSLGNGGMIREAIRSNIILSLSTDNGKDKNEKEGPEENKNDSKKEDKEDKKDKDNDGKDEGEKKDKDNSKKDKQGNDEKDSGQQREKSKDENRSDRQDQSSDKEDKKKDEKKSEEKRKERPRPQRYKSLNDKENQLEKQRKMVKVPTMLKELLGGDKELQRKYYDTEKHDKTSAKDKRDW